MMDTFKQLTANQFEAALRTLLASVELCPDDAWNEPVIEYRFCQVVFHTLFFTDYYLGRVEGDFKRQSFHQANRDFFREYEELEPRLPVQLYERSAIVTYVAHCRAKALAAIGAEDEASLAAPCGFTRRAFSRAELYVYTLRHIQHHAAQLILRLRLDHGEDVPWFGSRWRAG